MGCEESFCGSAHSKWLCGKNQARQAFFGLMFDCLFRQVLMKEGITDSDDLPAYFLAQSTGSCSVLIGKSKDGTEHDNDRKNGQRF